MTTLYLIRHAEAEGNIERRFQGHYNGKISENGEKQLRYLKKRFRKIHLNAVYTSPLSRAVATAEAVNYYAELPLVLDAALMEICGGGFEGKKYAELLAKEVGAKVYILNPITSGELEKEAYFKAMQQNRMVIQEAMENEHS